MFLNNSLIEKGICNGTIGIVTDFDKETLSVQVAFCVQNGIIHCWVYTSYKMSNLNMASLHKDAFQA